MSENQKTKIRIGINASFARKENTGIGQVTLNFLRKLSELKVQSEKLKDFEFFIYSEEELPASLRLPKNFTKRVFLPLWKRDDLIRKLWWEKRLLPKKVKKDQCDILLSLYQGATILPQETKHVMLVHDIIPYLFPEYLNNARKRSYYAAIQEAVGRADKIIAISNRTEKDLVQHWHIDPKKIAVAHIDVDEAYKKKVSAREGARVMRKYKLKPGYILNTGGLEVRKNVERLIFAYSSLLEKNEKAKATKNFPRLVIAGKLLPELAPLVLDAEKLIKKMNLTNQVKLLDFVPQKDMPALYANARVFAYPSLYEGFGLPVLEAMNQGLPVVAAKRSSLPEVGRDAILYFSPREKGDLEMVLQNVLANEHLRETLKKRGLERSRHFSWDAFVKKILSVSRELAQDV